MCVIVRSQDDHGVLRYLDTSTGQPVAEIRTKLGALKSLAQNPRNATVLLGHFNGCVSLWSPSVTTPLVKLQCHRGPLTSLAVDPAGQHLFTAAMDATVKVLHLLSLPVYLSLSAGVGSEDTPTSPDIHHAATSCQYGC